VRGEARPQPPHLDDRREGVGGSDARQLLQHM
jgi:hypothetical protein